MEPRTPQQQAAHQREADALSCRHFLDVRFIPGPVEALKVLFGGRQLVQLEFRWLISPPGYTAFGPDRGSGRRQDPQPGDVFGSFVRRLERVEAEVPTYLSTLCEELFYLVQLDQLPEFARVRQFALATIGRARFHHEATLAKLYDQFERDPEERLPQYPSVADGELGAEALEGRRLRLLRNRRLRSWLALVRP